ncbi:MAG: hypothetical protein RR276_02010 [Angelakisella sp.]
MNVNPLLMEAGTVLGVPTFPNLYIGKDKDRPDSYITFYYTDERPAVYADDSDRQDRTEIALHWFCKDNPQPKKKLLRKFLRSKGFTVLSTTERFEQDTGYSHIVVDAYIYGEIED